VRVQHTGCPAFDIDITGKTPVMILNEFCPKVLRTFPEIVTETTEDPANPFLTSIILDGIVVARGGYSNKKASRQVASRAALAIMCPLVPIPDDQLKVEVVGQDGGVVGASASHSTLEALEQQEVATLRLKLSDDQILQNNVGKTPVMVLQEHCHKYEGKLPEYATSEVASNIGRKKSYTVTVMVGSGASAQATSDKKKETKQKAALAMLRRLYPHVELWGELVESTNSRQREEKAAKLELHKRQRHARNKSQANRQATPTMPAGGAKADGADGGAAAGGRAPAAGEQPTTARRTLAGNSVVAQKMMAVVKEKLWELVAEMNSSAASAADRPISILTQPQLRTDAPMAEADVEGEAARMAEPD